MARKVRLVEHGDDRGRRCRDIRHLLSCDQLQRGLGREPFKQHGTATRDDRLQQAEIAPVEANRQIDELHIVLSDVHVRVDLMHGR